MANDPNASGGSSRVGQSVITDPPGADGPPPGQATLRGLLERVRDLNLTLISVTCGGPSVCSSDKE